MLAMHVTAGVVARFGSKLVIPHGYRDLCDAFADQDLSGDRVYYACRDGGENADHRLPYYVLPWWLDKTGGAAQNPIMNHEYGLEALVEAWKAQRSLLDTPLSPIPAPLIAITATEVDQLRIAKRQTKEALNILKDQHNKLDELLDKMGDELDMLLGWAEEVRQSEAESCGESNAN